MKKEVQLQVQKYDISEVMNCFISGLRPPEGKKILETKWYYDPHKGKVFLEISVQDEGKILEVVA